MEKSEISHIKLQKLGARVRKALEEVLTLAREAGVKRPMLYIESEGHINIMDQDHPAFLSNYGNPQDARVAYISGALPFGTDVGAW